MIVNGHRVIVVRDGYGFRVSVDDRFHAYADTRVGAYTIASAFVASVDRQPSWPTAMANNVDR